MRSGWITSPRLLGIASRCNYTVSRAAHHCLGCETLVRVCSVWRPGLYSMQKQCHADNLTHSDAHLISKENAVHASAVTHLPLLLKLAAALLIRRCW